MNVCYKLGGRQLEITEVRKDVGTSQRECLSAAKVMCLENTTSSACRGKEEAGIFKVLMLLYKAEGSPHLEQCSAKVIQSGRGEEKS